MKKTEYKGSIVAGSLLVRESRIIARLLLDNVDDNAWHQAIITDNVLQKRSPESAKRQARLIKQRLSLVKPECLKLIDKGGPDALVQSLLAASIKHSRLLGDFMVGIVKPHWQVFKKHISCKDWQDYLEICTQIDPKVDKWKETTRNKLRQVVFRILAESKYIDNTRSRKLLPVSLVPQIRTYLLNNSEDYVLKCMEITP
ncbi:MAG: hypothetical protein B6245_08210 [Desulfobacteraceae bacterium 4572_88]|nr:MAG: hypothetical protein B6245_08210 [Desulfobacteraceae bacterium 4572_88]